MNLTELPLKCISTRAVSNLQCSVILTGGSVCRRPPLFEMESSSKIISVLVGTCDEEGAAAIGAAVESPLSPSVCSNSLVHYQRTENSCHIIVDVCDQ
jgi:hypothetical protein